MKTGAELIAAERMRQIESEGWTPEHDGTHTAGQMTAAARCYAKAAQLQVCNLLMAPRPDFIWPWDGEWWKPSPDPIRNLVKAGALIAAEIDRLQRTAALPDSKVSDSKGA